MSHRVLNWSWTLLVLLGVLRPVHAANAGPDLSLAYETIEPATIRMGETATIRVTSIDAYMESVPLPSVTGLEFEVIARQRGFEFVHGTSVPQSFILIKVTPKFPGVFTIPGLTPKSKSLGLEVVGNDNQNPLGWQRYKQSPQPPPPKTASLPKGAELKAGGAAFVRLVIPARDAYVGESVPVDIEVGVRPGIVTSLNGLPTITGGDFTLNNLSRQPERRDEIIEGSPFLLMTWHSLLAAVKPGDFSLSVNTPLTVKINTASAQDRAFASQLGWPFSQILYNGIAPKEISISSPPSVLKVLPLPTQGRPADFSGAVGVFEVKSDISPAHPAAGDPLTLRLHVTGTGNFDRVDSPMFSRLDDWKTYPPKSSFSKMDAVGYKGEKVFEQPLIANSPGAQTVPGLGFSFFNPNTKQYERVQSAPINVGIGTALADSQPGVSGPGGGRMAGVARGLRPDHALTDDWVNDMTPAYFQPLFLGTSAALALILAASSLAVRPAAVRKQSKATSRALAQLDAAARSGDAAVFFEVARQVLLQRYAQRWQLAPNQVGLVELKGRLGGAAQEFETLWSLAAEAKYAGDGAGNPDFARWIKFVRGQLLASEAI